MKKLVLLISSALVCIGLYSQVQQVKIVSFTVKNQLPSLTDNWNTPGSLMLVAQKPPSVRIEGMRLVLQIKSNGAIICGNNPSSGLPIDNFTTRSFSAIELTGMLSGCHELKAGNYSLCSQFFNMDRIAISNEVCKEFVVEASKDADYSPPTLITPENRKIILQKDILKPIMFRWTPLVPKPKEPVTYRLKVWQLMEGQNGTQAMKANAPVVSKDVNNITQAVVTNLYTGPCKPPYLCDFIWNVQALSKDGKPIGRNEGTSEPFTFKMANNDIDIQIDSVFVSCCINGLQNIYIKIKNNLANTVKITQLKIDKVNGYTNNPAISSLSPVLPVNILGNGSQVFTGTIKCIDSAKTFRFFVGAEDALDNAITETEVETDTLDCPCDPCSYVNIKIESDSLKLPKNGNPNQVNLTGSFTGLNPNLVMKVTAEIIYFNITQTKDTNCAKCVYDSKYYGNFYPPASALSGYSGPVFNKPDYSRLITWNSTIIKDCGGQPHGGGGDNGNDKFGPVNMDPTP
ncbi:MAG TPA: hypothetical protein VK498_04140, partial [Ferruginibacter sp.]|nr:hypothetical protein [Ferruginibacter sp.]